MKKTLTAIVMAASLIMAPATAFAEAETEAAGSATMSLQGIDDQNNIWTVALDSAEMVGAVCLQIPDEDGSYPEENYVIVSGPMEIGEDSLTITDDEDGQDYVFGMSDVEGSETQVQMTYEPTESVVVLTVLDENAMEEDNMVYYAGYDEDAALWTVGFDFDNSVMAINVMTDEGENTIAGTFEDDGEGTLTITQEDGTVNTLTYEAANDDWSALTLTDESGTSITVSYINTSVLDEAA